ncbi:hypothetical protein PHMEG_00037156, partial [Phytophthora megakarya]
MLLLVQNEIGQVMARCLTCSENHEETRAILQPIVDKFSKDPGAERVFVCDHANGMRNLVNSVFGDGVTVKQDPFHVIQRMTEKVSDRDKKKWLAKSLSEASYDVERNLRPPEMMATLFISAVGKICPGDVRVKDEWESSVVSNLVQICRGDLFVENSNYHEGGGTVSLYLNTVAIWTELTLFEFTTAQSSSWSKVPSQS